MTARRQDTPFPELCLFQFADDRYCGLPSISNNGGFCRSHSRMNKTKPPLEEDLTATIPSLYAESGLDIHSALTSVFKAFVANRITSKRAATFGYLAQLILISDPVREGAKKRAAQKISPPSHNSPPPRNSPKSPAIDETTMKTSSANSARNFPSTQSLQVATTMPTPDPCPAKTQPQFPLALTSIIPSL